MSLVADATLRDRPRPAGFERSRSGSKAGEARPDGAAHRRRLCHVAGSSRGGGPRAGRRLPPGARPRRSGATSRSRRHDVGPTARGCSAPAEQIRPDETRACRLEHHGDGRRLRLEDGRAWPRLRRPEGRARRRHGLRAAGARPGRSRRRLRAAAASGHHACRGRWSHDARLALAQLAAAFFRHPSAEMQVVGITGTNGKTTTAYLVSSDLRSRGHPMRDARHGGVPDWRRAARGDAHDARSARRSAPPARDGRPWKRRLRDGSVVARAGASPRRRGELRRRASSPT